MPHPAIIGKYHPIGHPFVELESVDSTNNYAMALVHAGLATQGHTYFAHEQTRGRGQRGKTWSSTKGENILMSAVLEPGFLPPTRQFLLSMTIALAACDFLDSFAPGDWTIKWPNDLYWRDRKAGGILIESICKGQHWLYAVAGIGININQTRFSGEAANPVSLKQITGKEFSTTALAKELCDRINERYLSLMLSTGSVLTEYNERLFRRGETVRLKKNEDVFSVIVKDVTEDGQLRVVRHSENDPTGEILFDFGEVEWVLTTPGNSAGPSTY